MEYKIGQIFEMDGVWYQFVKDNANGCNSCVFQMGSRCANPEDGVKCGSWQRLDKRDGHFVRLFPIGDVYEQGGSTWQQYKCVAKPNTEDKRVYISHSNSDIGLIISVRLTENDDLNLIERKIGEIFEHNGEWYQCVENTYLDCNKCDFYKLGCSSRHSFSACGASRRDKKIVVFKRLEKVGEPYADYCPSGRVIYFQRYKCYQKPIYNGDFICWSDDISISIEIKNKEDMEEKGQCCDNRFEIIAKAKEALFKETNIARDEKEMAVIDNILFRCWQMGWLDKYDDTEHSNSENIGKNLKSFDLQAAKSGKPVCTRSGKPVRIICFDVKGSKSPIIALVKEDEYERVCSYMPDGRRFNDEEEWNDDLMMLPEKKEGYVKIRKDINLYDTKEEADRKMIGNDEYVTAKVEWEE